MVSLRKSLAAGALAVGALLSLGAAAQAQITLGPVLPGGPIMQQQTIVAYTTLALNLRAGPGTQYQILLSMPAGSPLFVSYCGDASTPWCFVNFNGYEGWASARYLSQNPPYAGYPQPVYPQQVYPTPGYPQVYQPQQVYPGTPMNGGNFGLWFFVQ